MEKAILQILESFPPISLEEMNEIRLMNRMDQKYLTTVHQLIELLRMAKGKYRVQVNNGHRVAGYRTLYLDTPDEEMYLMHHNRRAPRQKVRVRTYLVRGETFLEVKNKNNRGRTKKKRLYVCGPEQADILAAPNLMEQLDQVGGNELMEKYAWYRLEQLVPKMESRFERITLVNMAMTERLTIDCNIRFYHHETGFDNTFEQLVVIELKRDGNVDSPLLNMMRTLRIRPSGFSKYCIGSVMTNPGLKYNNFRRRIRRIQKMIGEEVTGIVKPKVRANESRKMLAATLPNRRQTECSAELVRAMPRCEGGKDA
jgi:hypothetical protein